MVRPTVETYRNPPDRVVLATLEFAEEIEKLRSAACAKVVTSEEQLASGMDRSFVRADGYFSFDRGPELRDVTARLNEADMKEEEFRRYMNAERGRVEAMLGSPIF